jgi:uncharacterized membrane protein YkoI
MLGKLMTHTALLLTLATTGFSSAAAAPFTHHGLQNGPRLAAKQGMSLEQAVAKVQRDTQGRILTAETVNQNGRPVHRIKVLMPNGNVRVIHIDAE